MEKPFAIAIKVTEINASSLSILNGGLQVFPQVNPVPYFVFPLNLDNPPFIVSQQRFNDYYSFVGEEDEHALKPIVELNPIR